jgi:hypothetical protein
MGSTVVIADVLIIAGLGLFVTGMVTRTFYTGSRFSAGDKQAPVWFGRAATLGLGAIFMMIGFAFLFFT